MSNRYKGGIISATPPTTTGGNDGVASGAWTLEQQMQAQAAGLWPNQPVFYIEDVFSTWLYTGNGSTQTITNGINLSGKGGLVWLKGRSLGYNHGLFDTVRGANFWLNSASTDPSTSVSGIPAPAWITGFNSNGFGLGSNGSANNNGTTYASWTFREQPKFFDVVTFTAPSSGTIVVPHNLGSIPGCVITKTTGISQFWIVNHRSLASTEYLRLDTSNQKISAGALAYTADASSVTFSAGYLTADATYVMYLFAHNAGGFGLTGTDNVISCGSFTTGTNRNFSVNLGYEPQWLLAKRTNSAEEWFLIDNMRGWSQTGFGYLSPNDAHEEYNNTAPFLVRLTATGFEQTGTSGAFNGDYIYIAIRRGPMATPTTGTSVFSPTTAALEPSSTPLLTGGGFPSDLVLHRPRMTLTTYGFYDVDRLRGRNIYLETHNTAAEANSTSTFGVNYWQFDRSDAAYIPSSALFNNNGEGNIGYALYSFRRAPGFFDEVCWSGEQASPSNQVVKNVNHNLGVAPELIITKSRNNVINWFAYHKDLTSGYFLRPNLANAQTTSSSDGPFPSTATYTSTTFGTAGVNNTSGNNYVAYLFATCPGVSKVGSYTGTGTTQTINCGFTAGSRFVLIKRTDDSGDWYVWDSARGIVAGNDPYLLLNSTAAEVTNTDFVDTAAVGFEISSTAPAAINANGGTFIFLAIA